MAASLVICGQPTRTSPLSSPATTASKLEDTKDPTQKVLKSKDFNVLKNWREVLQIRYKHLLVKYSEKFEVIWRDLDYDNKELALEELRSKTTVLPDSLARSFVQIRRGNTTYITVTVHFKRDRRQGGCCHVQGSKCQDWALTEFNQIAEMVERLNTQHNVSPFDGQPAIKTARSTNVAPPTRTTQPSETAVTTPTVTDCAAPCLPRPDTSFALPRESGGGNSQSGDLIGRGGSPSFTLASSPTHTQRGPTETPIQPDIPSNPARQLFTSVGTASLAYSDQSCSSPSPPHPQALNCSDACGGVGVTTPNTGNVDCDGSTPLPLSDLPPSSPAMAEIRAPPSDPLPVYQPETPNDDVTSRDSVSLDSGVTLTTDATRPTISHTASNPVMLTPPSLSQLAAAAAPANKTDSLQLSNQALIAAQWLLQRQQLQNANHRIAALEKETASLRASLAVISTRLDSVDELARDNAVKIINGFKATDKHYSGRLADIGEKMESLSNGQKDVRSKLGRLDSSKATLTNTIRDIQKKLTTLSNPDVNSSDTNMTVRDNNADTAPSQVKTVTPVPARPTTTKTSPMVAPEGDTSQQSTGVTDNIAGTGNPIPVIVTASRPATGSDGLTSSRSDDLTTMSSDHNIQGHAAPSRRPGDLTTNRSDDAASVTSDHNQCHAAPNRRPAPADNLARRQVLQEAGHLIIGDSILRRMSGRKMVCRRDERVQIISVSGMSARDLVEWLTRQPEAPHVRVVTFHVGINDCKRGEVTSRMWDDLIKQFSRAFPSARLQASTILPVRRAKCTLSETVTMSNANLCYACRKNGVHLVDNTELFAPHGKLQFTLYRRDKHDIVHPSHQGMTVLAQNIKTTTTECDSHMPSSSDSISEQLAKFRAASGTQAANITSASQGHVAHHAPQWSYINYFQPRSRWYGMYRPPVSAFYYQHLPLYN